MIVGLNRGSLAFIDKAKGELNAMHRVVIEADGSSDLRLLASCGLFQAVLSDDTLDEAGTFQFLQNRMIDEL